MLVGSPLSPAVPSRLDSAVVHTLVPEKPTDNAYIESFTWQATHRVPGSDQKRIAEIHARTESFVRCSDQTLAGEGVWSIVPIREQVGGVGSKEGKDCKTKEKIETLAA